MKLKHIRDEQPHEGQSIVQVDPPYEGHYAMGMRKYTQGCTWKELVDFSKSHDWPLPNFWWMPSGDFPFPDNKPR